jgi:hypothetical protein
MIQLAFDLQSSAEVFGIEAETLRAFLEREVKEGLIKINGDLRVSIFTLAQMLNTTPRVLLEIIEDDALGYLIDEIAEEDTLEGEDARAYYQSYLSGIKK